MTDDPQARLRKLVADPTATRDELWKLIDAAVTDINQRTAALQLEVEDFRAWINTHHPSIHGDRVQPG